MPRPPRQYSAASDALWLTIREAVEAGAVCREDVMAVARPLGQAGWALLAGRLLPAAGAATMVVAMMATLATAFGRPSLVRRPRVVVRGQCQRGALRLRVREVVPVQHRRAATPGSMPGAPAPAPAAVWQAPGPMPSWLQVTPRAGNVGNAARAPPPSACRTCSTSRTVCRDPQGRGEVGVALGPGLLNPWPPPTAGVLVAGLGDRRSSRRRPGHRPGRRPSS